MLFLAATHIYGAHHVRSSVVRSNDTFLSLQASRSVYGVSDIIDEAILTCVHHESMDEGGMIRDKCRRALKRFRVFIGWIPKLRLVFMSCCAVNSINGVQHHEMTLPF